MNCPGVPAKRNVESPKSSSTISFAELPESLRRQGLAGVLVEKVERGSRAQLNYLLPSYIAKALVVLLLVPMTWRMLTKARLLW